jgi:hypothetical protein
MWLLADLNCGGARNMRLCGSPTLRRNVSPPLSVSAVPETLTHLTSIMEVTHFSEMSVLTRGTRRHIPEDGILKSYIAITGWVAVSMKNAVFWDIKSQFLPHRRHITSSLQSPAG